MPIEIDGFAVLAAIARRPDIFGAARADINKAAKTLVTKQLKERDLSVAALRGVADALTAEHFEMIVDDLSDADIKSILSKVDKQNATIKAGPGVEQRKHLGDLARGLAEPSTKAVAVKPPKAATPAKPKVERSGNSKAMRARKKV